jgi:hypothetical protein
VRVIQDFRPLADSLEWTLQRTYYDRRGASAFFGGEVPFTATSSGVLSRDAAAILDASLDAASVRPVRCLELGPGTGLFAKLLLDDLRRRSAQQGSARYERVTLILADSSRAMLDAIQSSGVLAGHAGRYELVHSDPSRPAAAAGGQVHAVFLNYVLDSLPASVVRRAPSGDGLEQLCARTRVADGARLADYTSLSFDELVSLAESAAGASAGSAAGVVGMSSLADVYPALVVDVRYEPVAADDVPSVDALLRALPERPGATAVHSHGALDCLFGLSKSLGPGGFIMVNDFASRGDRDGLERARYPVYGGAVAIGLNFSQLDREVARWPGISVHAPGAEEQGLVARLLAAPGATRAVGCFEERFDGGRVAARGRAVERVVSLIDERRIDEARGALQDAMALSPGDWTLHQLAASFLAYVVRDREAARLECEAGLELNPLAVELWNVLGDCELHDRRLAEAMACFTRAIELHPDDVHGRYNAAYVLSACGDHPGALRLIAEGLALDDGTYRERLLAKQARVLARLAARREAEQERALHRVRPVDGRPDAG